MSGTRAGAWEARGKYGFQVSAKSLIERGQDIAGEAERHREPEFLKYPKDTDSRLKFARYNRRF